MSTRTAEQAPPAVARRILVIDDDADLLESLTELLSARGYTVFAAGAPAAARELLAHESIDLALVDIRLGEGDGLGLIEQLQQQRPDLPCIMMTAYADVNTAIGALQRGAFDYLRKPLDVPALFVRLERTFEHLALRRDKHAAEARLRANEARLAATLASVADAIITLDPAGQIESINPAAQRMFGYPAQQLRGAPFAQLLDDGGTAFEKTLAVAAAPERAVAPPPPPCESVGRRLSGQTFPVEFTISRADIADQIMFICVVRDITDRHRAIEQKQQLETQLRHIQKMDALGQLAGGIAHDFNNILTAILGHAELLRDAVSGEVDPATVLAPAVEQIEHAGQRAATLTRQLLVFSRRQVVNAEVLDTNTLVAEMQRMFRRLIPEEIDLRLELAEELLLVRADAGQLEQVITNLVINARDAMPGGGTLTITTAARHLGPDGVATAEGLAPGDYVELAVGDSGCGMDAATLERVFEPFFTTKPVGKGTGLGLSMVHGIVRQAGGRVILQSTVNQGTVAVVHLPAVRDPAAVPRQTRQSAPRPAGGNETILVCEDELAVRQLARSMLESTGYHVLVAENGRRALELLESTSTPIDLLLTDVIMPEMNGRTLAETLVERSPRTRVLYMSGYASDVIANHGVLDESADFIEKPFDRTRLLQRVRQLLDRPRATAD